MRRTLLTLAGGAALGLVLAASCGSSASSPGSQTVAWSAPGGHHVHANTISTAPRRAARTAAERAPECNTIRLLTPSGQSIWLTACGSGPGAESSFQDWTGQSLARRTVIMDGVTTIDPATCTKTSPCVLIGQSTPGS